MIKPLVALCVTLLAAAPAGAQIASVPVQPFGQPLTVDTSVTVSVDIFGYTSTSKIPRILAKQTVSLPAASLLEPQLCAEFPGYRNASMTVMQVVLKSTVEAPTYRSDVETVTPKQPLSINVKAGKKLWAVYTAPAGQQATLRFYVDEPPAAIKPSCKTSSSA